MTTKSTGCGQVVEGEVCLEDWEDMSLSDDEVLKKLRLLPGMGPFSAANMLQLQRSWAVLKGIETVRHIRSHQEREDCTAASVEAIAHDVGICTVALLWLALLCVPSCAKIGCTGGRVCGKG